MAFVLEISFLLKTKSISKISPYLSIVSIQVPSILFDVVEQKKYTGSYPLIYFNIKLLNSSSGKFNKTSSFPPLILELSSI